MRRNTPTILGLLTLSIAYTTFRAASDVPRLISPQGCRMSWMSPSYLLQPEFNASWTPLASRYSLWLYREVGWEPNQPMGLPVLFIPGNAGSSHQVRSIASSAARQYFSSPFVVSHEFTGRGAKSLDFYAVEFNEDLSAFHGSTLDSQISYTSAAVEYILSRYPSGTRVIVMGHSMGGIVGTALLPSENITALITMSTPHTLPPARFDGRIEAIYNRNKIVLREDETPILSICGGATDMMIPSESCILPEASKEVYRRTVFTSALEGAWTGAGHREMVWCHQVRWRVARAALELGITRTVEERAEVLDRWLRDGQLPPGGDDAVRDLSLGEAEYEALSGDMRLVLNRPLGKRTYLLPIPRAGNEGDRRAFTLYVSQGRVVDVAPHHVLALRVSVHHCAERSEDGTVLCNALAPNSVKLLPTPIPGKPFPVPDEGADESEGVVFFEAELPYGMEGWVGVTVDAGDDGRGWVVGGFDQPHDVTRQLSLWELLFGGANIPLPRSGNMGWRTYINVPRLPASALLVYRLVPKTAEYSSCAAPLFSPLLVHTSQNAELHYYRLESDQPIFLHTHSSAPYVPPLRSVPSHGLNLTIHSPVPSCQDATELLLSVDWWASMGRIGTRYPTTLLSWGVGLVSLLLFDSWGLDGQQRRVHDSLGMFVRCRMPVLMGVAGAISMLPLGPNIYLGVGEELGVLRAVLAAFLVAVATGMVCVSWWLLVVLMWPLRLLGRRPVQRRLENTGVQKNTVISMALVLVFVFLMVPWQVAFLGCWIIQLLNCNATARPRPYPGSAPTLASTPTHSTPSRERDSGSSDKDEDGSADRSSPSSTSSPRIPALKPSFANAYNQNMHMVLLMTWLLPLVAPVLVVWVRTIQTAGYMTSFKSDHNVFSVAPVLVLVALLGRGRPLDVRRAWGFPVRWGWVAVAAVAFLMGGRRAYVVYDAVNVQLAIVLSFQVRAWLYG